MTRKEPEEIPDYKPGQPRRGHPAYNNRSIYVDPKKAPMQIDGKPHNVTENDLVQLAMQEKFSNSRKPEFTEELVKRKGSKRAKALIAEMEKRWGFPESGVKGFIKRRLS